MHLIKKESMIEKLIKSAPKIYLGLALFISTTSVLNFNAYYVNQNTISEKKTAVFTSGRGMFDLKVPDAMNKVYIDYFMYTPVTLKQNLQGMHVDWFSNVDKETLLEKLNDHSYENLVFIGHGSKSSYSACDDDLNSFEVLEIGIPKRKGQFLQYTCGKKKNNDDSLKDVLFKNESYERTFNRIIDPLSNYGSAWVDLLAKNE